MTDVVAAGDNSETEQRALAQENPAPEIAGTMCAGAVLGGLTMALVTWLVAPHQSRQARRGTWWGMCFGGASGLLAGWKRIYEWRSQRGRRAFLADHTWGLATTSAGVVIAAANVLLGAKVEESLSQRQNRLVFDHGFILRSGFALSTGYVVTGAADRQGVVSPRRRRLVTDHEDVHIWQARRWGPLYPVLYVVWFIGGVFVGIKKWRADPLGRTLMTHVDAAAYYSNPFEWRAYTNDGNWPPATADSTLVWPDTFRFGMLKGWRENQATPH